MKLRITIVQMGGGYKKAIFGQTRNTFTNEWCTDSVFGATNEELIERLLARLPEFKKQLRSMQL